MRKPTEKHPEPALTFGAPRHLANVTVILVEPAVPGNIGSAARAMKTMGLTDLVVVGGPKDFATHQQAIMLGHGAGDVLEKARVVTTWEEATDGLHWLVGTTHRKRRAQFPQIVEARPAAIRWVRRCIHIPRPRGRGPVEAMQKLTQQQQDMLHSAPARARPR